MIFIFSHPLVQPIVQHKLNMEDIYETEWSLSFITILLSAYKSLIAY